MPFLGVHPSLLRALADRGINSPTPVQQGIMDVPSLTQDLLVSAQTGSGKTVAFGLAMAGTLLGEHERMPAGAAVEGPLALIITPTRELAMQVATELSWLYSHTGVNFTVCVGGTSVRTEQIALHRKPHIVVGTPGRLNDHLDKAALKLGNIRAVVLDEADEMLDMGFREELEALLKATPSTRRTLMFSATIPKGIALLAKKFQNNAFRIEATSSAAGHADIEHVAMQIGDRDRVQAVVNALRFYDAPCTLVFCATRDGVARMGEELANRGFGVVTLSGELSQRERTSALQALRDGRARICVATDVAARGLDLPSLDLVIHADVPQNRETLVHRSGRTGRAGRQGVSVLLVPRNRQGFADRVLATRQEPLKYMPVPSAAAIRKKDDERVFATLAEEIAAVTPEAKATAAVLMQAHAPQDLVAVLVAARHKQLPEVRDVGAMGAGAGKSRSAGAGMRDMDPRDRGPRERDPRDRDRDRDPRSDRGPGRAMSSMAAGAGMGERPARGARQALDARQARDSRSAASGARPEPRGDTPVFSVNVGRFQKADPRWIIPLLCRRGGITKDDIGSIDVMARETRVTIAPQVASLFATRVKVPDTRDPHIRIVPV